MIDPGDLDRLVARAAAGGADAPAAMSEVYARLQQVVYNWVRRNVNDPHTAEDLTQEVWLKVAQKMTRYQPGSSFEAWLNVITHNTLRDYYRHVQRRPQEVLEADHLQLDQPRPDLTPHQQTERRELARALTPHLNKLRPNSRTCLLLRFFDGLSITHTAQIMGKTEGAIRTLTVRSLQRLAQILPPGDSSAELVEELLTTAVNKGRVEGVRVKTTQDAKGRTRRVATQ